MLYVLAVFLVLAWGLALLNSWMLGGFIHVLLGVAVGVVLTRYLDGRRIMLQRRRAAGH